MWADTELTRLVGIDVPIVAAPMGGGPSTPELAAAVSSAGGLGSLALGYLSPDAARAAVRRVRELTDRPFAGNLFVPEPVVVDDEAVRRAIGLLAPLRRELGLDEGAPPSRFAEDFDDQLDVLLEERVPVVSVTFGVPDRSVVERVKGAGALLVGTATTVAEGRVLEEAGFDVVCAQGAEAGGHRGGFLGDPATDLVGLAALVPALTDAVALPVVASGGLMDGRGVLAALALGASGVQLGTAFLRCPEAGTNDSYRAALVAARETATVVTSAFSGRPARGLRNRYVDTLGLLPDVPAYPVMNALTRELRARSAALGQADLQSLWAGQGVALGRELPAGDLVRRLCVEVEQRLHDLGAGGT